MIYLNSQHKKSKYKLGINMKKQKSFKRSLIYLARTLLIIFLCTLLNSALYGFGIGGPDLVMIYLVGVLLIIVETSGYFWGVLASVICIVCVNFFFTLPRFAFGLSEQQDAVTLIIFLLVCFIAGTLMTRLQKHAEVAEANEKHVQILYETGNNYLNSKGMESILRYASMTLLEMQGRRTVIYPKKNFKELGDPYYLADAEAAVEEAMNDRTAAQWCLSNMLPSGFGTPNFSASKWKYLPIKSKTRIRGVVGFYCGDSDIEDSEMTFVNAAISQMALAIEREQLYQQQKRTRMEVENEQTKNSLLRSVSHDLRTPLTGIAGSSNFILESYDSLDKETILSLLKDISSDAVWLNNLVENLLSMTRIQDSRLDIRKENEVIDDLVSEASSRVSRILKGNRLSIDIPEDVITVPADGRLIVQALVNLVDNAINHTAENSDICIRVRKQDAEDIIFEVEDNGGGIAPELLKHIFESFVTAHKNGSDSHRGIGLGLSICDAIVKAHNGTITAFNNQIGGATFRFTLPL